MAGQGPPWPEQPSMMAGTSGPGQAELAAVEPTLASPGQLVGELGLGFEGREVAGPDPQRLAVQGDPPVTRADAQPRFGGAGDDLADVELSRLEAGAEREGSGAGGRPHVPDPGATAPRAGRRGPPLSSLAGRNDGR